MVALEGALEGRGGGVGDGRLAEAADAARAGVLVVEAHQAVALLAGPPAAPDPPGEDAGHGEDDGAADADDDADDGVARLLGHARVAAAAGPLREARGGGGDGEGGRAADGAVGGGHDDDGGACGRGRGGRGRAGVARGRCLGSSLG